MKRPHRWWHIILLGRQVMLCHKMRAVPCFGCFIFQSLQHLGNTVCRAVLGRWIRQSCWLLVPVVRHLPFSKSLDGFKAIGHRARFWQDCCCSGHNLSASHLFSFAPASSAHDNSVAAHPSKASSQISKLDYQIFQQQVSAKEGKHLSPYNCLPNPHGGEEKVKLPPSLQSFNF